MDTKDQQQRKSRRVGLTLASIIAGFASQLALADQPTCSTRITNQWGSGSQVEVTIHNDNNAPLSDWHIELSYNNGRVDHSWNAIRVGDNPASFSAPNWQPTINAGGRYTFGYIALHSSLETPNIDACYAGERITDEDQDGVSDAADLCPATPTGESADSNGCSASQRDSDEDGINDAADQCPATPTSETANAAGCSASQLDDDSDSVNNAIDQCPATPVGEAVNTAGCSASQLDDDNDGITNNLDQCAATPATESADSNGCSASQRDSDEDGINDAADQCPATPASETANAVGCSASQLDDDSDSVNNALDQCPTTPAGEAVNTAGCSASQLDDDNDGVTNNLDQCAATPATESADSNGCSASQRDSDEDGINDAADQCPATPTSETANAVGCSASQLDDDSDSVNNAIDQCPATPAGEAVNTAGCSASQLDDDNDGVMNNLDQCAATPATESADSNGCSASQRDSDEDGISDAADQCPATPTSETANSEGCSASQLDDDNDGVSNDRDICPATPVGEPVDVNGCAVSELDADQDGVSDAQDLCPNTDSFMSVTHYGCAFGDDEDGDFIPNEFDFCPFAMGFTELHGCAPSLGDFDNDGVTDENDICPFSVGSDRVVTDEFAGHPDNFFAPDNLGCSDFDKQSSTDFIKQGQDLCPNTFPSFISEENNHINGCTQEQFRDDDNDGIINGLDICPNDFGIKTVNGCNDGFAPADADFDGIPNELDACPFSPNAAFEEIGPNGCLTKGFDQEDTDQDGVINRFDACPQTSLGHIVGVDGCTVLQAQLKTDQDQDHVPDPVDMCPGSNVFFGEHINQFGCFIHERFLDQDGDGIANEQDSCPNEPGFKLNNGCPTSFNAIEGNSNPQALGGDIEDRDNDGIPDFDDQCPYTVSKGEGPVFFNEGVLGCISNDFNDDDLDGVINGKDRCPNTLDQQFLDSEGCSDWQRLDSDGDQLINGEDLCPTVYGRWQHNGCADDPFDSDRDGVPNERDQCPATPGGTFGPFAPVNPETGCADTEFEDSDFDNVPNLDDRCPNTPFGAQVFNHWHQSFELVGCDIQQSKRITNPEQEADEDSDGVPDIFDQCPGTPPGATVDGAGCDTPFADDDRDGVQNIDDQCLGSRFARPMDFNGCELAITPVVNDGVRLKQLPLPSPENPNGPQEHELQLSTLITWPADLDNGQAGLTDVFLEVDDKAREFIDIFQFSSTDAAIHVRPDFREITLHIAARIFIPELEQHTNWFEIVISPKGAGGSAEIGSLIVNDPQLLFDTDIRFSEVFFRLTNEPFFEAGTQLFRQFWDSQRSPPVSDTPFFCTGETNGFPIVCNRPETNVAFMNDFDTQREMDFYTLTAVVNRMDLRRGNWDDCGEHRLVFAAQGHPQGRKFFIFEARLPNPTPGDIRGCEAPIRFWQDMAQLQGLEKADRIRRFFIDGDGMPPVIAAEHFFHEAGQIRTNQFLGSEWLLKEHKLVDTCSNTRCGIFAETVTVKENPFGELFNPDLPLMPSPLAQQAAIFQNNFLNAIDDLAGEFFGSLKMTTPDEFNHGQSHSSGIEAEENDFRLNFFRGSQGSPFANDINFNLEDKFNADGSPLQVDQLLARATGLTCGGCHNPERFGLTAPGAIGAMRMPDGSIIDSWPRSLDFVHIDETGRLSPALEEVFLPIRGAGFSEVIEELNQKINF